MLFKYKAVDNEGINKEGEIDAPNRDMAISGLQRRGLVVISIKDESEQKSFFSLAFFERVSNKDIVILSRQIATLFEAQVSALKAFTMLSGNTENKLLGRKLTQISDDLSAGVSISGALAKQSDIFSEFYVNMVKVGEETGRLNQTFLHLAEYLDRQYSLTSKTRNALIYPAFVVLTFFVVMTLMFVVVIPKLSAIITDSDQAVPIFTQIVIAASNFFIHYGFFVLIFLVLLGIWFFMLLASGARTKQILFIILLFTILGLFSWQFLLTNQQKQRVLSVVGSQKDPLGVSYSQNQALIALGSGGFWGKGLGKGTQTQLGFLPAPRTDFIFASIGEELGFLGVSAVLASLGVIFWRLFILALTGMNNFVRLFSLGYLSWLFVEVAIHTGMNLGILPVIGISLPFVSYGGSHLLALFMGLGIINSIQIYSK